MSETNPNYIKETLKELIDDKTRVKHRLAAQLASGLLENALAPASLQVSADPFLSLRESESSPSALRETAATMMSVYDQLVLLAKATTTQQALHYLATLVKP